MSTPSNFITKFSPSFVAIVVTISGFCSLVYQVVWDRTLKYNFGGDSISSAIVTGTFLLGLGIGALSFGKWRKRPFTVYAVVEIAIGAYAVISYYLLARLSTILGQLFTISVSDASGLRYVVVIACIFFLLPPCILMGGTLPLIFNCFIRSNTYQNKTVGMIYGLNTAGASIGILSGPFLFLNHITLPSTLLIVGLGNILLGIGVGLYGRAFSSGVASDFEPAETWKDDAAKKSHLALVPLLPLSFVSGLITLSFEVSLFRTVGLIMNMSPYTFPLVLMPFLLALALGSMLFSRFTRYSPSQALRRVGVLFILAVGSLIMGVFVRYFFDFQTFSIERLLYEGHLLFPSLLLVVPFAFFSGGIFPLLLRLASNRGKELPGKTGLIYLANSVGAFLGAMFSQFYGLPYWGTQGLIMGLWLIGIITGIICFIWAGVNTKKISIPLLPLRLQNLAIAPALFLMLSPWFIPQAMWDIYTFGYTGNNIDRVEGVTGIATLHWNKFRSSARVRVNGQYMSALPNLPKHMALVSVALALPHRERVLVLGLGGGGMIRELVNDPQVKEIVVVDWSYELPLLLDTPQAKILLDNALHHPKVKLYSADARVITSLYQSHSVDVVIDNLAIVGWAGSTGIKSTTYFQQISRIIKPSGAFVFSPNYGQPSSYEAILTGLKQNFEYVRENQDTQIILASAQPVEIDRRRADEVLEHRGEVIGLSQPYRDWLLEDFRLITLDELGDIPPIVDELLIYEYPYFGTVNKLDEIAKHIPKPTLLSPQVITLPPAIYDRYVGQYQINPELLITVSRQGEQLLLQVTNEKQVELLAKSETDFFFTTLDAQIEFMNDETGQVTGLLFYYKDQKLFGKKIK